MRRPSHTSEVARQWQDLKGYEAQLEQNMTQTSFRTDKVGAKTNKEKIKQMKTSANKKISSFKTHITDFYKNTFSSSKEPKQPQEHPPPAEVSSCPNGETGVSGAIRSLESMGARIKSSRSLQSLELVTADSLRSVKERTSGLSENVKRRYGSQLNVAMGRYEPLDGETTDDLATEQWRRTSLIK